MITTYRLPSGKKTKSPRGYTRAWRKMARELEKRMPGFEVVGFDPGFMLRRRPTTSPLHEITYCLPTAMVREIIANTLPLTIWANRPPWSET